MGQAGGYSWTATPCITCKSLTRGKISCNCFNSNQSKHNIYLYKGHKLFLDVCSRYLNAVSVYFEHLFRERDLRQDTLFIGMHVRKTDYSRYTDRKCKGLVISWCKRMNSSERTDDLHYSCRKDSIKRIVVRAVVQPTIGRAQHDKTRESGTPKLIFL